MKLKTWSLAASACEAASLFVCEVPSPEVETNSSTLSITCHRSAVNFPVASFDQSVILKVSISFMLYDESASYESPTLSTPVGDRGWRISELIYIAAPEPAVLKSGISALVIDHQEARIGEADIPTMPNIAGGVRASHGCGSGIPLESPSFRSEKHIQEELLIVVRWQATDGR